jgi:hypothetical protein
MHRSLNTRGARASAVVVGKGGMAQNVLLAPGVGGHACRGWCVWRLRCLRTRRAAWAREISDLANHAGARLGRTAAPMYAGSCRQRSRQTWSRGPFCAGWFQRLAGRAAASATPHIAPVREAGDRQWAVGATGACASAVAGPIAAGARAAGWAKPCPPCPPPRRLGGGVAVASHVGSGSCVKWSTRTCPSPPLPASSSPPPLSSSSPLPACIQSWSCRRGVVGCL